MYHYNDHKKCGGSWMADKNQNDDDMVVILPSGFLATREEFEWAKEEIANSPEGKYLGIADAITIKRGLEQFERGEFKGHWQPEQP